MNKRIVEGVEVEVSSGNVFADLGLPDAATLQIKSGLTVEITKAIRERGLTQAEAAKRVGLTRQRHIQIGDNRSPPNSAVNGSRIS